MRFFVVENKLEDLGIIRDRLRKVYPEATFWPEENKLFEGWGEVATSLEANTENSDSVVVILDLSLDDDVRRSIVGVGQALTLRSIRPLATFIVYTQYPDTAERSPKFAEAFDGIIDKGALSNFDSIREEEEYIQSIVDSTLRKSSRLGPSYAQVDSLGLRLAFAALGGNGLNHLVYEVARGWDDVEVSALTSGFSGAFLLSIAGRHQGGAQKIIVKWSRERETIEQDTRRVNDSLAELGPLAEALAPYDQRVKPLLRHLGYYYRQAPISGKTLLEVLRNDGWNDEARNSLNAIISLELRCYQRERGEPFALMSPRERFTLTPIDIGRATQSLEFLTNFAAHVKRSGGWPSNYPAPNALTSTVQSMLAEWDTWLGKQEELFAVGQHGDLNPNNVLVPTPTRVVLIDFSRLGRWPVGYDIGRLAMLLRLRLTDHVQDRDWFEHRLDVWIGEKFAEPLSMASNTAANCPSASFCDEQFGQFISTRTPSEQDTIIKGYRLGTLWDLIKVLSYTDISPSKRLWALMEVWRIRETFRSS